MIEMQRPLRGKDILAQIKKSIKDYKVDRAVKVNFDLKDVCPQKVYVAWVDIMGSSEKMSSQLTLCAKDIGRFHAAVFQAYQASAAGDGVSLHALVDGAYIVAKSAEALKRFLGVVMRSLTETFLEASFENRFLVRAAVAWGEIINSEDMIGRLQASKTEWFKGVASNAVLGAPFANAHAAEHEAPPLGVYVHKSAIGAERFSENSVWAWWETFDDVSWLSDLSEFICSHFDRVGDDYYVRHLPMSKVSDYKAKVRSYFRPVKIPRSVYFSADGRSVSSEVAGTLTTGSGGCVFIRKRS